MELMLTTNRGLEDVTCKELEKYCKNCKPRPFGILGKVRCEIDIKNIPRVVYRCLTINKAILLLKEFEVGRKNEDLGKIYKEVKEIDWENIIERNQYFAVRTERFGVHEYTSVDISKTAGQGIYDRLKDFFEPKVDLDYPDIIVKVEVIGERAFVGLDLVGDISLHKRGYKIYNHPAAIKSTLASQIIMLSRWEDKKSLLDPLTGSGTIPIEASIYALNIPGAYWRKNKLAITKIKFFDIDWDKFFEEEDSKIEWDKNLKIYGFDKYIKHVRGAELNSIRAKVRKYIKWARIDLEWLDVKMEEKSIDYIITNPPYGIKAGTYEEARKVHKLLFYQGEWVLDEGGKLFLITARPEFCEEYSKEYGFEKILERDAWNGDLKVKILGFEKKR